MSSVFTDERSASQLSTSLVEQMANLDAPFDDSGMGGYVSSGATHMLFVVVAGYVVGKIEYCRVGPIVFLEWICAPGAGSALLELFERNMAQAGATSIVLTCGLDPAEQSSTVLRRVNFYIKHRYRATAIEYMGEGRTRLRMAKQLNTQAPAAASS